MTEILNTSFFDPIAPYIREVQAAKSFLKIELPAGLVMDEKEILKYFNEDVAVHYTRGEPVIITGTLKDPVLFNYLLAKYYSTGPTFNP
jgi:hypothetical protein